MPEYDFKSSGKLGRNLAGNGKIEARVFYEKQLQFFMEDDPAGANFCLAESSSKIFNTKARAQSRPESYFHKASRK